MFKIVAVLSWVAFSNILTCEYCTVDGVVEVSSPWRPESCTEYMMKRLTESVIMYHVHSTTTDLVRSGSLSTNSLKLLVDLCRVGLLQVKIFDHRLLVTQGHEWGRHSWWPGEDVRQVMMTSTADWNGWSVAVQHQSATQLHQRFTAAVAQGMTGSAAGVQFDVVESPFCSKTPNP